MNRVLVVLGLGLGPVLGPGPGLISTTMAQTPLFKIIAASSNTLVDNTPIQLPHDVYNKDQQITIPEEEYVALVTADGEAFYYFKSFTAHEMIEERRFSQKMNVAPAIPIKPRLIFLGYQHRGPYLYGDSLFVSWAHPAWKKSSYSVSINDVYDDPLDTIDVGNPWILRPVQSYFGNAEIIVLRVTSVGLPFELDNEIAVRKVKNPEKVATELAPYTSGNADHLIVRAALFDLNDCYFDQQFMLYQMITKKFRSSDAILSTYFEGKMKEFDLEKVNYK